MSSTDFFSPFRPPGGSPVAASKDDRCARGVPFAERQIVRLPIFSESGTGKETEAKTETGIWTTNGGGENVQLNVY